MAVFEHGGALNMPLSNPRAATKVVFLVRTSFSGVGPANLRESFCESGEGVRLPRERVDLRGSPGKLPGKSGELPGKSGEPPDCC